MSELDFLINVRRILLSALALLDKRIELLRHVPVTDAQEEINSPVMAKVKYE